MADVTGLVTGVPGLVVACVEIYRLAHTARRLDSDGNIIVAQVGLEQAKFAFWLEEVGLTSGPGSKPTLRLHASMQKLLLQVLLAIKGKLLRTDVLRHP
jgi:hypothetical protein